MTVAATSDATIAAIIDNNVENVASTKLKPAKGQSFGAVLASNKVSSTTTAIVDDVDPVGTASSISARGSVTVRAVDNASINASLRLTSTTEASTFPNKPAEAKGYAFAVTLNDVRGDSKATIANTQVTIGVAASIVEAHETSSLIAHTLVGAETTTSGGTLQGGAERCRAEQSLAAPPCWSRPMWSRARPRLESLAVRSLALGHLQSPQATHRCSTPRRSMQP